MGGRLRYAGRKPATSTPLLCAGAGPSIGHGIVKAPTAVSKRLPDRTGSASGRAGFRCRGIGDENTLSGWRASEPLQLTDQRIETAAPLDYELSQFRPDRRRRDI